MSNNHYKLTSLNYVINPKDQYRQVLLHCVFDNINHSVVKQFYNDILKSEDSIFAIIVLTAWAVKYKKGSGIRISIHYLQGDQQVIKIQYIDSDSKNLKEDIIFRNKFPNYLKEAVDIVLQEIEDQYNNSISINNTGL